MEHEKIATVTVTYNRKDLLVENIKAILEQEHKVDAIIIVDNNSNDNSKETVFENFPNNDLIKYIYLEENIGGAGGFYTGCKYAFDNNYDWILLMDDDGKPKDKNTILNLMNEIKSKRMTATDKVMINSLVMCNEEKLSFGLFDREDRLVDIKSKAKGNTIENHINPFNGTLISKGLVREIGFPNKEFFIKGDEQDYFNRAKQVKAYIATVVNSLYYHPTLSKRNIKVIKLLGKKRIFFLEKEWKEYYRTRNYTYMYIKMNNKKLAFRLFLQRIESAIICKGKKIKTIKMIIKGYKDGKKGRLGNTVKPM